MLWTWGKNKKRRWSWFFHVSLIILASKKIDCCTEGRQRIFYHWLDFKAININKTFFRFAKFWWFSLLEIPLSDVSAPRVTFSDKHLAVCHCPCMRSMQSVWDFFFSICMSWLDFPGKSKHLFWETKDDMSTICIPPLLNQPIFAD